MFIEAFHYKRWADKRTLEAINTIDPEAFPDSFSFVLQQLNHMVIVEDLFKSRLKGEPAPHDSTNTEVVPGFSELSKRLITSGDWYISFVSSSPDIEQEFTFTFADDRNGRMTVQEILFHIVNHGSYHRGNIAHALDLAAVPHPSDGYAIYIHESDPNRRVR